MPVFIIWYIEYYFLLQKLSDKDTPKISIKRLPTLSVPKITIIRQIALIFTYTLSFNLSNENK